MALGRSRLGLGSSSARWVTASGVPMVKAPLRTPVRKATPPDQPVLLAKSLKTNLLEACFDGMAARVIMVTIPPMVTTKRPNCCRYGRKRLKKMVTAMQIQVMAIRPTKRFHCWMT